MEELRQRVPALYGIVGVNVAALACTHYTINPWWQVVGIPSLILLAILSRIRWWVRVRPQALSAHEVHLTLRNLSLVGGVIGFLVLSWALSLQNSLLMPVGITSAGHTVVFVGITFMSCIFLLMHHRSAAMLIGVSIVVPFTLYLLASGRMIETAIALNVLLVSVAMLYVAVSFSRHFERSVRAAVDLVQLNTLNARMAASDALTGLPNRRQFFADLEQAGLGSEHFVVIVLDLDGFKPVNDVYGHHAGDEVLRQIAARFRALAPERCSIARLGGDEFGCLLEGVSTDTASGIADRLLAACAEPVVTATFTAVVGASAGMCSSTVAREPIQVYERADYALFEAKRAGRGRAEAFNTAHEHSMCRDSTIAQQLCMANLDEELTTLFQPIVAAGGHAVTAFEVLVRWTSPCLGPVAPQEFIPIAERTDLIFKVTLRVLASALSQAQTWPAEVCLKVNLSVRDLMSREQTEALATLVRLSTVAPARVTFEITETILAESMDLIRANVDILRAQGCRIAIDDFGVGYSSLNYIHMLAPDIIKIDRCFITQSTTNDTTKRVIRSIVELARNVGAKSVAEGIETLAEAKLMAELGCDELQGYYFSRPISAEISTAMALAQRIDVPAALRAFEASGREQSSALPNEVTDELSPVSGPIRRAVPA